MDAASALLNPLFSKWGKSRGLQRSSFLPHYAVYSAPTAMALAIIARASRASHGEHARTLRRAVHPSQKMAEHATLDPSSGTGRQDP